MAGIIPMVVGLVAAGAAAFAFGGKASAAPAPVPPTFKPKKKPKEVTEATEQAIKAAMRDPDAMKAIIEATARTGDPSKLWNLGRTILLNSQGLPNMQAVAAQVLANAVSTAVRKGQLGDLVATALANGDAGILIGAAQSAAALNPTMAAQLNALIAQLQRSAQPPATRPASTKPRPPVTRDEQLDTKAAQTATQVVNDAIKATEAVQTQTPGGGTVTTLPEMVITASPSSQVLTPKQTAAMQLTEYLQSITANLKWPHEARFKEDKSKVGQAQAKMGLGADGKYGPGTAKAIASLGIVPVPPFYWPKAWQASKKDYTAHIAAMQKKFSDLNWAPALKGVDRS